MEHTGTIKQNKTTKKEQYKQIQKNNEHNENNDKKEKKEKVKKEYDIHIFVDLTFVVDAVILQCQRANL